MRHQFLACIVLLASLPASAGQERMLSLDEALTLTRSNNRDLVAARAVLEEARTGVARVFGALLPTLSATGSYTHNYKNESYGNLFDVGALPAGFTELSSLKDISILKQDAWAAGLNLTVPIAAPAAYASLQAVKQDTRAAEANFMVSETAILLSAAQAYFAAAGADELLQARQHAIEVARVTLQTAQARLNAGTVNRQEVTRAQLALVNAVQAQREATDTREESYRSLETILGLHEPFHVAPPASDASAAPPPNNALVDGAYRTRPEFAAYEANINAAIRRSHSYAWQWAPVLAGFGALNGYNYDGVTGDKYSWDVGLQLNWILYDGGIRDAWRRQSDAARVENEARAAHLRDTVADDIANSTRKLETKRMAVDTAHQSVDLASDTLSLLRTQYAAGTALQLDVLQAQDALIAAEVQQVQARFDLALAELTLERDAGTFPGTRLKK